MICGGCGNEFIPRRANQRSCCHRCAHKVWVKSDAGKQKRNSYEARRRFLERMKLIELLGGKCVNCGNTDVRVLQVNHINGGGNLEVVGRGHPLRVYKAIVSGQRRTDDIDVRCANCNILYEYERGARYYQEVHA